MNRHSRQQIAFDQPANRLIGFQYLRRIVQLEHLESANEVIFISERETGKTLRIIHTRVDDVSP